MPAAPSRHDHFPRADPARRTAIRAAVSDLDEEDDFDEDDDERFAFEEDDERFAFEEDDELDEEEEVRA